MENLWKDIRFGLRTLVRSPATTLLAMLTLALGIGANSAIFSVVNRVLLDPLPYPRPEELEVILGTQVSPDLFAMLEVDGGFAV